MVQQIVVHPYHGIIVSNKRTINTCTTLDKCPGNYAEWKTLITKGNILYYSIYTTLLKRQYYTNGEETLSGIKGSTGKRGK